MKILQETKEILMKDFNRYSYKNLSVDVEHGSNLGDGFVGRIVKANISYQDHDSPKKIPIVVKRSKTKADERKYISMQLTFGREIFVYSVIMPKYEELMNNYHISPNVRCRFAKFYGSCKEKGKEYIVLENLKEAGFEMVDEEFAEYMHAVLAVREIAKLHGLSFVLEKKYPRAYTEIANSLTPVFMVEDDEASNEGYRNYGLNSLKMYLTALQGHGDVKNKLLNEVGPEYDTIQAVANNMATKGSVNVISHGDLWFNNILFKNMDGQPAETVSIDYQLTMYSSIANDLLYFIGMSTNTKITKKFLDLALEYHKFLRQFLASFGFDVDDICTFDQLKKEIKDRAIFAIIASVMRLPLKYLSQPTESHLLFSKTPPDYLFTPSLELIKDVNDIVRDFVALGLLCNSEA